MVDAVYLDTSALIKAYVAETGSLWLQSQPWTAQTLFTSHLTAIEAVCALARRRREGVLTPDEHAQASRALNYDLIYRYCLLDITPAVMDAACQLAEQRPLRAGDAIHLASAWLLNQQSLGLGYPPVLFLCADDRLLAAAQAEGLRTDNPNRHA